MLNEQAQSLRTVNACCQHQGLYKQHLQQPDACPALCMYPNCMLAKGRGNGTHTELPFGAHVSGTAPACKSLVIEATASSDEIDAHASSMAFSTCNSATPDQVRHRRQHNVMELISPLQRNSRHAKDPEHTSPLSHSAAASAGVCPAQSFCRHVCGAAFARL